MQDPYFKLPFWCTLVQLWDKKQQKKKPFGVNVAICIFVQPNKYVKTFFFKLESSAKPLGCVGSAHAVLRVAHGFGQPKCAGDLAAA